MNMIYIRREIKESHGKDRIIICHILAVTNQPCDDINLVVVDMMLRHMIHNGELLGINQNRTVLCTLNYILLLF